MFHLCKVVTVFGRAAAISFTRLVLLDLVGGHHLEPLARVQRTLDGVGQVLFSQVFPGRFFQENHGRGADSAELLEHWVFFADQRRVERLAQGRSVPPQAAWEDAASLGKARR